MKSLPLTILLLALSTSNSPDSITTLRAMRVTDIFDAYDEESRKEALNQGKDETIDAEQLALEISMNWLKHLMNSAPYWEKI